MQSVRTISEMRQWAQSARATGKRIGFVPTMGALHAGHLSLVRLAREHADVVVMSIFVNPLQFNSKEDLEKYPNTLAADCEAAAGAGVDFLFLPRAEEMYPRGSLDKQLATTIKAGESSFGLCGAGRPEHFDGVVTVVAMLFNLVQPHVAVFGEKDFQQLAVVRALVRDLCFDVEIVSGPLVRDADGLALSSRNLRLSAEDRYHALFIPRSLFKAQEMVLAGERRVEVLRQVLHDNLTNSGGLELEYAEIVDPLTLQPLQELSQAAQLLVAAKVGNVRLIDNVRLDF